MSGWQFKNMPWQVSYMTEGMCSCLHAPKLVVPSRDADRSILKLSISTLGENMKDTDTEKMPQVLKIFAWCDFSKYLV